MTAYVALLRAVNVSGTGKLPMADLRRMGEECGFADVTTFIASGNLLFRSAEAEAEVQRKIAAAVETYFGKPVAVMVRTAEEMAAVAAANPFPDEPGSRHMVTFLHDAPPADTIPTARNVHGERMALGRREIYVAYGEGIRHTKLVIPAAKAGTARNITTVGKLAALLGALA